MTNASRVARTCGGPTRVALAIRNHRIVQDTERGGDGISSQMI